MEHLPTSINSVVEIIEVSDTDNEGSSDTEKAPSPLHNVKSSDMEKAPSLVYSHDSSDTEKAPSPVYFHDSSDTEKAPSPVYSHDSSETEKAPSPVYFHDSSDTEKAPSPVYFHDSSDTEKAPSPVYYYDLSDTEEEPLPSTNHDSSDTEKAPSPLHDNDSTETVEAPSPNRLQYDYIDNCLAKYLKDTNKDEYQKQANAKINEMENYKKETDKPERKRQGIKQLKESQHPINKSRGTAQVLIDISESDNESSDASVEETTLKLKKTNENESVEHLQKGSLRNFITHSKVQLCSYSKSTSSAAEVVELPITDDESLDTDTNPADDELTDSDAEQSGKEYEELQNMVAEYLQQINAEDKKIVHAENEKNEECNWEQTLKDENENIINKLRAILEDSVESDSDDETTITDNEQSDTDEAPSQTENKPTATGKKLQNNNADNMAAKWFKRTDTDKNEKKEEREKFNKWEKTLKDAQEKARNRLKANSENIRNCPKIKSRPNQLNTKPLHTNKPVQKLGQIEKTHVKYSKQKVIYEEENEEKEKLEKFKKWDKKQEKPCPTQANKKSLDTDKLVPKTRQTEKTTAKYSNKPENQEKKEFELVKRWEKNLKPANEKACPKNDSTSLAGNIMEVLKSNKKRSDTDDKRAPKIRKIDTKCQNQTSRDKNEVKDDTHKKVRNKLIANPENLLNCSKTKACPTNAMSKSNQKPSYTVDRLAPKIRQIEKISAKYPKQIDTAKNKIMFNKNEKREDRISDQKQKSKETSEKINENKKEKKLKGILKNATIHSSSESTSLVRNTHVDEPKVNKNEKQEEWKTLTKWSRRLDTANEKMRNKLMQSKEDKTVKQCVKKEKPSSAAGKPSSNNEQYEEVENMVAEYLEQANKEENKVKNIKLNKKEGKKEKEKEKESTGKRNLKQNLEVPVKRVNAVKKPKMSPLPMPYE